MAPDEYSCCSLVLGFSCHLDVGSKVEHLLMLPVSYNQYLVHEEILGLTGNIRACEYSQLQPEVLSIEFSRYFSMDFYWGMPGLRKYSLLYSG